MTGIVGVVLCITWHLYVCDFPSNAKNITEEELQAIHGGSGGRVKPRVRDRTTVDSGDQFFLMVTVENNPACSGDHKP